MLALAAQMIYVQFRGGPSLYKQPPSAFAENGIARKTIDSEDNQGWGGEEGGAQWTKTAFVAGRQVRAVRAALIVSLMSTLMRTRQFQDELRQINVGNTEVNSWAKN